MINKVMIRCCIISNYWYDQINNLFFNVAVIDDLPSYTENGENRYGQQVFDVCLHPRLHKYFFENCFLGQKCYMEGMIVGSNNLPVIVINQIDLLERKSEYNRKMSK